MSATTSNLESNGFVPLEGDQEDWKEDDWFEGWVPLEDDQEVLWTFPARPSLMSRECLVWLWEDRDIFLTGLLALCHEDWLTGLVPLEDKREDDQEFEDDRVDGLGLPQTWSRRGRRSSKCLMLQYTGLMDGG